MRIVYLIVMLLALGGAMAATSTGGIGPSPRAEAAALQQTYPSPPPAVAPGSCLNPSVMRFAVIGDYGACTVDIEQCKAEAAVAHFVRESGVPFVVSVGDMNYTDAVPPLLAQNYLNNNKRAKPGQAFVPAPLPPPATSVELYEAFINTGRFFVAYGNHDYHGDGAATAKALFSGQSGKNVSFRFGPLELFVVDTNQVAKGLVDPDGLALNPPDLAPQLGLVSTTSAISPAPSARRKGR